MLFLLFCQNRYAFSAFVKNKKLKRWIIFILLFLFETKS